MIKYYTLIDFGKTFSCCEGKQICVCGDHENIGSVGEWRCSSQHLNLGIVPLYRNGWFASRPGLFTPRREPPCSHQLWNYLREDENPFICCKSERDSWVGKSADWSLYRLRDNNMAALRKLWREYGATYWQGYVSLLQSVLQSRSLETKNSEAVVSQTKFHSLRIQRGLDVRMFCSNRTAEGLPEETAALDWNCVYSKVAWYLQYCDLCGHNLRAEPAAIGDAETRSGAHLASYSVSSGSSSSWGKAAGA